VFFDDKVIAFFIISILEAFIALLFLVFLLPLESNLAVLTFSAITCQAWL
jgi:hypothetical protein